ncbi:MAG: hypothetical protein R3D78_07710 [Paracoccaceae bacterium]
MIRPATPADAPPSPRSTMTRCAPRPRSGTGRDRCANRIDWMAARQAAGLPVLVLDEGGAVAGYASFGPFRAFDGYRGTVEHSVYVRSDLRGGGAGGPDGGPDRHRSR